MSNVKKLIDYTVIVDYTVTIDYEVNKITGSFLHGINQHKRV